MDIDVFTVHIHRHLFSFFLFISLFCLSLSLFLSYYECDYADCQLCLTHNIYLAFVFIVLNSDNYIHYVITKHIQTNHTQDRKHKSNSIDVFVHFSIQNSNSIYRENSMKHTL